MEPGVDHEAHLRQQRRQDRVLLGHIASAAGHATDAGHTTVARGAASRRLDRWGICV
jgi:hypothetical protein